MDQEIVWDKIADLWNSYRQKEPSEISEFLKNKKGKVLDLGCGSGRSLVPNENIQYYGVDFSAEMLKFAEKDSKKKKANAVFFKASLEKLPFEDNYFDAALLISVLHCIEKVEDRENALKEMFRVLKKDSEAMITVWKREDMIDLWTKQDVLNFDALTAKETFVNWKKDNVNYPRYYYFYEREELEELLKKVGFEILKKDEKETPHTRKNIIVYAKK